MSEGQYKWYQVVFNPANMLSLNSEIPLSYTLQFLSLKHLDHMMKRRKFSVKEREMARDFCIKQWPELVRVE